MLAADGQRTACEYPIVLIVVGGETYFHATTQHDAAHPPAVHVCTVQQIRSPSAESISCRNE